MSDTADFSYWAGPAALGLDEDGHYERLLPVAVQQAELFAKLGGDPPTAFLLAWPTGEFGLMSCIAAGTNGGNSEFVVAWPFATYGIEHELWVAETRNDPDCSALKLLQVDVAGTALVAFDSLCAAARGGLASGRNVRGRLHGWAVSAQRGSTEPVRYKPEDVSPSIREAFREAFERDGEIVIETRETVALLPRSKDVCPLYEFRSPIRSVRSGPRFLDEATWVLTITISRPEDHDGTIEIDLTVIAARWDGDPPQPGDAVEGIMWLHVGIDLGQ